MAFSVQVLRNHPRTELQRTGYAISRRGAALQFASLQPHWDSVSNTWTNRYQPCNEPTGVWREAETGAILLRPTGLAPDLYTNAVHAPRWVPLTGLQHVAGTLEEIGSVLPGGARRHWTQLPSDGSALGSISVPSHLAGRLPGDMCWIARTYDALAADESFTVSIQPFGTADERVDGLLTLFFGGRHLLAFGQQGNGAFYSYVNNEWHEKLLFGWGAGFDLSAPVSFTVIPFGPQYLAVVARGSGTVADGRPLHRIFGLRPGRENCILLRLGDLQCQIDTGSGGEAVKCGSAPLYIAAPNQAMQVGFAIVRNRYAAAQFAFCPEQLDGPKTVPSSAVVPIGYTWRGTGGVGSFTNDSGTVWNPATDTRLVPMVSLTPDSSGVYTPELWGIEIDIPAVVGVPNMTAIDASASWRSIYVRMSRHPGANEARVRLDRTNEFERLFAVDATLRILQNGVPVFDGYVDRHSPVIRGFTRISESGGLDNRAWIDDEIVAYDMWRRLDETPAAHTLSFSRRTVGAMLEHLLARAGFSAAEMAIDSGLYSITIDGWSDGNIWQTPGGDCTVGDCIRSLIDQFGVQQGGDLTVRWTGAVWSCGFAAAGNPTVCFVLDSSLFPAAADADRWAAGRFYVLSDPEFHIRRMPFNSLTVYGASSDGSTQGAFSATVSPHPRALTDSSFAGFDGRLIPKISPPYTVPFASSLASCARAARRMWDREYDRTRTASFEAEFHAGWTVPGAVAWIACRAPVSVPSLSISAGDPVSLGKWMIEDVQAEIDSDSDPAAVGRNTAGRAFHSANFTLRLLGGYSQTGYPMFTEVLPEP